MRRSPPPRSRTTRARRKRSSATRPVLALALLLALLLPAACAPPGAEYRLGLGTRRIAGTVELEAPEAAGERPFIVVFRQHHGFVELGGRDVRRTSAAVVSVGPEGGFEMRMPADVVAVDMFFVAPEHLTDVFQFSRSVGVGEVIYNTRLRRMGDWRSHFYTFLEPQLQPLVSDPRYNMGAGEELRLGNWLIAQKQRMEGSRSGSGSGSGTGRP